MKISGFIYHKRAEKYSDCQDYFRIDDQNNRIAISDGMSQSIFPQWWAKILVDDYLENGHMPQDILPLQKKWQEKLLNEIRRREDEAVTNPKRDPWRLKNLLAEKSGAGATLCGLTFGENEWFCECLGDSCVIAINHDYSLNIYTSQVGEFGNHPDYFDSFRTGRGVPIRKSINQDVKAILMVTDPFAELFQLHENDLEFTKARFEELQNLTTHKTFSKLVERWRDDFGMHNDDSTLILIEDVAKIGFHVEHLDDLTDLCVAETPFQEGLQVPHTTSIEKRASEATETIQFEQSYKEAINQFNSAGESLLSFCPDNKRVNMRATENWLIKFLNQTIKKFLKK